MQKSEKIGNRIRKTPKATAKTVKCGWAVALFVDVKKCYFRVFAVAATLQSVSASLPSDSRLLSWRQTAGRRISPECRLLSLICRRRRLRR